MVRKGVVDTAFKYRTFIGHIGHLSDTLRTSHRGAKVAKKDCMIGDNVKKFRKKKGLTQDNLARKADIPYTTLTKLESNVVKKRTVQTIAKIAKALDLDIEELIK